MAIVSRIGNAFRTMGAVDMFLYGCRRLLRRLAGSHAELICYHLVAQPVPDTEDRIQGRSSRIVIRRIEPEEIRTLDFGRPAMIIEHRLRQSAVCFAAFRDDQMVGFIWMTLDGYDEDEVRCRFEPDPAARCAWDFDVFVDPCYRMSPLFLRLWDTANRYLRERNIAWTMSRISAWNVQSMASHRRLGARFLGRAVFLRLGSMQLFVSSFRPWIRVTPAHGSPPVIRVRAPD